MFHNRRRLGAVRVPFVAAGAAYTAQGVNFNGSTSLTASALTGIANGSKGIVSFWYKVNGGNGNFQIIIETRDTQSIEFYKSSTNKWHFQGAAVGGAPVLVWDSTNTYTAGGGWFHFLASWDLSLPVAAFYITDVADAVPTTLTGGGSINYTATADYDMGARSGGSLAINMDIADFYVNHTQYLDFTVTANRRKFISGTGTPVNLGSTGSTPTGTAPIIFLSGSVASWHVNDGTGGGFSIVSGSLSASATNPP